MPTAIWKSRLGSGLRRGGSGSRGWDLDCEEEEAEEMEEEDAEGEEENSSDKI